MSVQRLQHPRPPRSWSTRNYNPAPPIHHVRHGFFNKPSTSALTTWLIDTGARLSWLNVPGENDGARPSRSFRRSRQNACQVLWSNIDMDTVDTGVERREMATPEEMRRRTEQQRRRRMTRRACGHCGRQAEAMLRWGGQTIAVCNGCRNRLGTGHALPEGGYRWRYLQDQGPWCDVDEPRPCGDCAVFGTDERTARPAVDPDTGAGQAERAYGRRLIDRFLGRPSPG